MMAKDGSKELSKLISRLENIGTFLIDESDKFIGKHQKVLVSANVDQMKSEGKLSTDEDIRYLHSRKGPAGSGGAYSAQYEKYKSGIGGNTNYVDLFLTGKFHKSILLFQMNPGEWRFVSEDEKAIFLLSNYGQDIFGISEDSLDKFVVPMEIEINERTDKYLTV